MDTSVQMRQAIYLWLEQHSGVPYDFKDDIKGISGDNIFIDPYEWKLNVDNILELLSDAVDCIEENGSMLPDSLPPKVIVKRFVVEDVLMSLVDVVQHITTRLHLTHKSIKTVEELNHIVEYLSEFIELMSDNTMDEIISENMFDEFSEDKEDLFDIHRNDLSSMHTTISSIRHQYADED